MFSKKHALFFAAFVAAALIIFNGYAARCSFAADDDDEENGASAKPRHEVLYDKYKNAPDGSDEKEEYYSQYQAAYTEYQKELNAKKTGKKNSGDRNKTGGKTGSGGSGSVSDEEVSAAYEKYKKAPAGSEEKELLYEEYMKVYAKSQPSRSDKNKSSDDEDEEETAPGPPETKHGKTPNKKDGNSGNADLERSKQKVNAAYDRYKKAPDGSADKENYYEEYQRAYADYQKKLAASKKESADRETDSDENLTISSGRGQDKHGGKQQAPQQAKPMIGYMQGNYLVDTPGTPVPKVSGGGGGNMFKKLFRKLESSTESMIGAQTCAALELLYGVNTDNMLNDRVNRVGNRVASVANRQDIKYRFKVLNMKDANAFAVPGGTIYATRGLLDLVKSDSELAAVLAHEVGHQCAKHSMKAIERGMLVQIFLNKSKAGAIKDNKTALEIANVFMSLKYSRDDEFEADRYGFNYASITGYNPYGMVTFFQKLQAMSGGSQPSFMKFLSTHPDTRDRISRAQDMANGFVATRPQWKAYAPGAIK